MSKEYLKSLIDCVSGIEVKSEAEQIAKYELIEYVEDLQQRMDKAIELLEKTDYEYSSRTELFNIISEATETLGGKNESKHDGKDTKC